jgi:hypothetical protein
MDLRAILKMLKFGIMVRPQLKDNGAFANNTYFDTIGLGAMLVLFIMGDTDIAVGTDDSSTPPALEECDTTGGTYTAVSNAALAAVIGAGDDAKMRGIFLDLTKTHKRYVQVNDPTAGDGTAGANMCALGVGFPLDESPRNAAGMGLEELIEA